MPSTWGRGRWTARCLQFALLVTSAGCASVGTAPTASLRQSAPARPDILLLNRDSVPTVAVTVLDVLRQSGRLRSLQAYLRNPGDGPLVVLDGVLLTSLERLQDIPAMDAQHIRVLNPREALFQYGSMARGGAIVVITRR